MYILVQKLFLVKIMLKCNVILNIRFLLFCFVLFLSLSRKKKKRKHKVILHSRSNYFLLQFRERWEELAKGADDKKVLYIPVCVT